MIGEEGSNFQVPTTGARPEQQPDQQPAVQVPSEAIAPAVQPERPSDFEITKQIVNSVGTADQDDSTLNARAKSALLLAADQDPNAAADLHKTAEILGISPDVVALDPKQAKQDAANLQIDAALKRKAPALKRWLLEPMNGPAAKDNIDALARIEEEMLSYREDSAFSDAALAGYLMSDVADIAVKAMTSGTKSLTPEEVLKVRETRTKVGRLSETAEFKGFFGSSVGQFAGQQAAQVVSEVGATQAGLLGVYGLSKLLTRAGKGGRLPEILTGKAATRIGTLGSTAISAQYMYQLEAGMSFFDLLDEGIPEDTAKGAAQIIGGINAAIEFGGDWVTLSMTDIGKKLLGKNAAKTMKQLLLHDGFRKAATEFGKKSSVGALASAFEEFSQELVSVTVERGATAATEGASKVQETTGQRPEVGKLDILDKAIRSVPDITTEDIKRAGKAALAGAIGGGVFVAGGNAPAMISGIMSGKTARVREGFFKSAEAGAQTELAKKAKNPFINFFNQAAKTSGGINSITISKEAVENIAKSKGVSTREFAIAIGVKNYDESEKILTEYEIDPGSYAANIAGNKELFDALAPDTRINGLTTAREEVEAQVKAQEEISKLTQMAEENKDSAEFMQMKQENKDRLLSMGRSEAEADKLAEEYAMVMSVLARNSGLTLEDFKKQFPFALSDTMEQIAPAPVVAGQTQESTVPVSPFATDEMLAVLRNKQEVAPEMQEGATRLQEAMGSIGIDLANMTDNEAVRSALTDFDLSSQNIIEQNIPETVEVDGVARPTTNSDGKPIAQNLASIRNFWRWFGDSKVVDDQGRPLVVYHGTDQNFEVFDLNKFGRTDPGFYGKGIYLTSDQGAASAYSTYDSLLDKTQQSYGANVMPLYASIKNPYIWPTSKREPLPQNQSKEEFTQSLIDQGYDGVLVPINPDFLEDPKNAPFFETVVFDSTQIKSATGNVGTFDPQNPSILLQQVPQSVRDKMVEAFNSEIENNVTAITIEASDEALAAEEYADFVDQQAEKEFPETQEQNDIPSDKNKWDAETATIVEAAEKQSKQTFESITSDLSSPDSISANLPMDHDSSIVKSIKARLPKMIQENPELLSSFSVDVDVSIEVVDEEAGLFDVKLKYMPVLDTSREVFASRLEKIQDNVPREQFKVNTLEELIESKSHLAQSKAFQVLLDHLNIEYSKEGDDRYGFYSQYFYIDLLEDDPNIQLGSSAKVRFANHSNQSSKHLGADFNIATDSGINTGMDSVLAWMAKNASNIATKNGTPLSNQISGQFDVDSPQVLFQGKADSKELFIQHNLTAGNLLFADKMGGLAAPSLAITKASEPMDNFGEITLIGPSQMAKPSATTKVFGSDVYSPRYPDVKWVFKSKDQNKIIEFFREELNQTDSSINYQELTKGPDYFQNEPFAIIKFLKSKGIEPNIQYQTANQSDIEAVEKYGLSKYLGTPYYNLVSNLDFRNDAINAQRQQWVENYDEETSQEALEQLEKNEGYRNRVISEWARTVEDVFNLRDKPKFDHRASRDELRGQIQSANLSDEFYSYLTSVLMELNPKQKIPNEGLYDTKWIDHTLNNVVKVLKKNLRGGEGFNYGVGSIRSKFSKQFRSLKEISKNKDKLVKKEDFEKIKDETSKAFFEIADFLKQFHEASESFRYYDAVSMAMMDSAGVGVPKALIDNGFTGASKEAIEAVADFLSSLSDMETEYFEVKITRPVMLNEFVAAVVPKDSTKRVRDVLEKNGLKVYEYSENRKEAIDVAVQEMGSNILFQGGNQPRGALIIDRDMRMTMALLPGHDISTMPHELGHRYLEILNYLARQPNATEANKAQNQRVFDWFVSHLQSGKPMDWYKSELELAKKKQTKDYRINLITKRIDELQAAVAKIQENLNKAIETKSTRLQNRYSLQLETQTKKLEQKKAELASVSFDYERRVQALEKAIEIMSDEQSARMFLADLGESMDDRYLRNVMVTPFHELFAETHERFLMEGKAPASWLQDLFRSFSIWLKQVYRRMIRPGVPITPELKEIFDRMYVAEEEIEMARAESVQEPLFLTADEAGMTPEEFQAYTTRFRDQLTKAKDKMVTKLVSEAARDQKRWWKARRKEIETAVAKAVDETPDQVIAQSVLGGKISFNIDGEQVDIELDRPSVASIVETFGQTFYDNNKTAIDRFAVTDGGIKIKVLADRMDMAGKHEDLMNILIRVRDRDELVKEQTDRAMLLEQGDTINDGLTYDEAVLALHNEERENIIDEERKILTRMKRMMAPFIRDAIRADRASANQAFDNVFTKEQIKAEAAAVIASTPLKDLKPSSYLRAAQKNARLALEFTRKKQYDKAVQAKNMELLNFYLYRASTEAQEFADRSVRGFKRFQEGKLRKAMVKDSPSELAQIDAIFEKFSFKVVPYKILEAAKTLKETLEEASQELDRDMMMNLDPRIIENLQKKNFQELTFDQLKAINDHVKALHHIHKTRVDENSEQNKKAWDERVNAIVSDIVSGAERPLTVNEMETARVRGLKAFKKLIKGYLLELMKPATLVYKLQGWKKTTDGALYQNLIRPLQEANNRRETMMAKATVDLAKIMDKVLARHKGFTKQTIKFASHPGRFFSMENVYAVALNSGNEGNLQRLMDNEGWNEVQRQEILGILTKEDWDSIQEIWKYMNQFRPLLEEHEKRLLGNEPEWVEPLVFNTKFGQVTGGYYPIVYDPGRSADTAKLDDVNEAKGLLQAAYGANKPGDGFLKSRAARVTGRPLLLTMDGVFRGTTDVIHYLTHFEALLDASRVLNSKRVSEAITKHYGSQELRQLRDLVKDIAVGPRGDTGAMAQMMGKIRRGGTAAVLGFNLFNSLQNLSGIFPAAVKVSKVNLLTAMGRFAKNPLKSHEEVLEKSEFMRNRSRTLNREIREIESQLVQTRFDKFKKNAEIISWFPVRMTQAAVDIPIWMAAYEDGLVKFDMNEKEAVAYADQMVIDTQGDGAVGNLAAIQRGSEFKKILTVFYGYFSTLLNLGFESLGKNKISSGSGFLKLMNDGMFLYVLPILYTVMLRAGFDDEDDDLESFAKKSAAEGLSITMAQFPFFREFTGGAKTMLGMEVYSQYSGPAGLRIVGTFERFAMDARDGSLTSTGVKAGASVLGIFTHLPTVQMVKTIEGAIAIAEGDAGASALIVGAPPKK